MQNPTKYYGKELEYLEKVLNSEAWTATEGSWNNVLETEFAKKFGAKYAVTFNSGTSTLHAALEAVGVRAGDEVISPALSVIMNTTSTIHANAVPVYADVDRETFNIDPEDIRRKITPKTKAIQTVSLYGLSPDMDPIMEIAKEYGIAVIEDNAQCFLGTYKGRPVGKLGDIASYSFENSKHMSCGEGGIIITDNEEYAMLCRKIGGHGFQNLRAEEGRIKLNKDGFQNPEYKRVDELGWNYRLSEFSAAISLAQLESLEQKVEYRVKTSQMFLDVIRSTGCDYLIPQKVPTGSKHTYWSVGVVYEGLKSIGVTWSNFRKEYVRQGGDGIYGACSVAYLEPLVSERKFVRRLPQIYENVRYEKGLCPVSEELQSKLMQFKNNYRSLELAEQKATALEKTILHFKGVK
jgi:perosamine synthetase